MHRSVLLCDEMGAWARGVCDTVCIKFLKVGAILPWVHVSLTDSCTSHEGPSGPRETVLRCAGPAASLSGP